MNLKNEQAEKRKLDRLVFGIYPGGNAGTISNPPSSLLDKPESILKALNLLQPADVPFLIRGYIQYNGSGNSLNPTPLNMTRYVTGKRKLDLVLCYRTEKGDIDDWTDFIRATLEEYGPYLEKIQLTEEPNNPQVENGGDGSFPNIHTAIIAGVITAKDEIKKKGLTIKTGFNATPSFDPDDTFWNKLGQLNQPAFIDALDYVGLDFFPDVFRPLPPTLGLQEAVRGVLTHFRNVNLAHGKIPAEIPIHITENGWPTDRLRTEARQAQVMQEIIYTINEKKEKLNITHYEFFDLRDADSSKSEFQFGLLHDDYTPKPAFDVYCRLIRELGCH
jgi:hypothetical protein